MHNTSRRKALSILLTFAMILSLFGGMALSVSAEGTDAAELLSASEAVIEAQQGNITSEALDEEVNAIIAAIDAHDPANTQAAEPTAVSESDDGTISGGGTIGAGGTYTVDGGTPGVIQITTSEKVTLTGGSADSFIAGICFSVSGGANIELENLYANSPYNGNALFDFTDGENVLSIADDSVSVLESEGYNNGADIHVGPGVTLTIEGDTGSLYIYKHSGSAAIGANINGGCGTINFNGGNVFIKASQTGPAVGCDVSNPNYAININGGNLNIVNKARGAGIGGSNQSAGGDVSINGGSTVIITDFSGSAIGHGASSSEGGHLYYTGGTLKTVITPNAASFWGTSTEENTLSPNAITAVWQYGPKGDEAVEAGYVILDVAEFTALSGLDVSYTYGGTSTTLYTDGIIDDYTYTPNTSTTTANWSHSPEDTYLCFFIPQSCATATATVSVDGASVPYSLTASNDHIFTVEKGTPSGTKTVNFQVSGGGAASVSMRGSEVSSAQIAPGGTVYFTVTPAAGTTVASVMAGSTVLTPVDDLYALTNVGADTTVTINTTGGGTTHTVSFDCGAHGQVIVDSQPVTSVKVDDGADLSFTVKTETGYAVSGVTVGSTEVPSQAGVYTLSNVTADTTVTVSITDQTYKVTFPDAGTGANYQVRYGGQIVTEIDVMAGASVDFKVEANSGYKVDLIMDDDYCTVLHPNDHHYVLDNVTRDHSLRVYCYKEYSDTWTSGSNYDASWYDADQSSFVLSDAADLAGLSYLVNSGTNFAGKTVTLGADVDLSGHYWVPIGGNCQMVNGRPVATAKYFAGTFDGAGHTVSNILLGLPTSEYGGYGLFGYVNDGVIENVTVSGLIYMAFPNQAIGGVVGYLNGSVINCHNEAEIFVCATINANGVGGVVGVIENLSESGAPLYVDYCSNSAKVTGRARVGGVVGAVYCATQDGVIISRSWNTGEVSTMAAAQAAYVGGVAGYCKGSIGACYNTGSVCSGGARHIGGIVGLLYGLDVTGTLSYSYNSGSILGAVEADYREALWAYTDNNEAVTVLNSFYVEPLTQTNDTAHYDLATAVNVSSLTADQFKDASVILSGDRLGSVYYQMGTTTPVLKQSVGIYVDGQYGSDDNDGLTPVTAVQSLSRAAELAQAQGLGYILVCGRIDVSADTTLSDNLTVTRAPGYNGSLFRVSTGCVLTLNGTTIHSDGYHTDVFLANSTATDTYIKVETKLTETLIVECANPGVGTRIAAAKRETVSSAADYLKYVGSAYGVTSSMFDIVLTAL